MDNLPGTPIKGASGAIFKFLNPMAWAPMSTTGDGSMGGYGILYNAAKAGTYYFIYRAITKRRKK